MNKQKPENGKNYFLEIVALLDEEGRTQITYTPQIRDPEPSPQQNAIARQIAAINQGMIKTIRDLQPDFAQFEGEIGELESTLNQIDGTLPPKLKAIAEHGLRYLRRRVENYSTQSQL